LNGEGENLEGKSIERFHMLLADESPWFRDYCNLVMTVRAAIEEVGRVVSGLLRLMAYIWHSDADATVSRLSARFNSVLTIGERLCKSQFPDICTVSERCHVRHYRPGLAMRCA
jgi:hypothetical protein